MQLVVLNHQVETAAKMCMHIYPLNLSINSKGRQMSHVTCQYSNIETALLAPCSEFSFNSLQYLKHVQTYKKINMHVSAHCKNVKQSDHMPILFTEKYKFNFNRKMNYHLYRLVAKYKGFLTRAAVGWMGTGCLIVSFIIKVKHLSVALLPHD